MQTQYALKQAGLTLPVTKEFQQHITTLLANQVLQKITEAVVINFYGRITLLNTSKTRNAK